MRKTTMVLFSSLILVLVVSCVPRTGVESEKRTFTQISAVQAKELMDSRNDFIILDVRTAEEFSEGHIPGAILIPDYEIEKRAEEELLDKDQLILVYCRSGNRSKTASRKLADLGYSNVFEFGGIRSWPYETIR